MKKYRITLADSSGCLICSQLQYNTILLATLAIYLLLLRPLVIAIAIIAVGCLIYRWYTGRRLVRVS